MKVGCVLLLLEVKNEIMKAYVSDRSARRAGGYATRQNAS